ncbi:carboxy-terminal protease [Sphingobacterium spiritivorum ATCC 33300]|uniref:Carboxy-terminal protease n=2 Tax=Sphingobacterium spiritivorum TaxID=258 RepID=C2G0Y9_SPHSI|nr:carboxy-terminal protease [Sphingobacterium spiritivorum ATCC 33300]
MNFNNYKFMFKNLVFALSIVSIVACGAKPRVNLEEGEGGVKPTMQHEIIAKEVANLLENVSYKKVPMNDSLSNLVFNNLIKSMDQGKNYLLQSDIDEFQQYKNELSQDFKSGDLSAAFHIFNVYSKRYLERMNYALAQIDVPQDFNQDDYYTAYREKLNWFKTDDEAKEQWRKRVKYDLLNLKLSSTGKEDDAAKQKETLRKRYNNLISQAKKNKC